MYIKMKVNKKLFLVITILIIVLGGIYLGVKEWRGASPHTIDTNSELTNINISDLMVSMNIHQITKPKSPPDFTLMSLDGEQIQLSSQRGKVVLLSFWATW